MFVFTVSAQAEAPKAPEGYTPVTLADLNKSELKKRLDYPDNGLVAKGDFDGDQVEDIAQMFYTKDGLKVVVMAYLSKNNPESKWVEAEEFETNKKKNYNFPLGVIITKAEPATYNKVCSGFNGVCVKSRGETPTAKIKHNSINILTGNSEWVMYWDETKMKFLEGYSE
jgi:hypothetical protein